MKKNLLFVVLCLSLGSRAQSWVKKFSCDSFSISAKEVIPYDGQFFVLGSAFDSIHGINYGTVLSRINAQGKPLWMKKYSFSTMPFIALHGLLKSKDGNLLLLAHYGNTGAVIKTDTAGNFLWGKSFGWNYFFSYELEETTNGNIIVAGINEHYSSICNVFLIRMDAFGNALQYYDFASTYQWNAQLRLGDIQKTQDGGCILVGSINMNFPVNGVFLAKIDSLGNTQWTISLTHTGNEWGTSITETPGGFVYSGRDGNNLLIGKIDKNGTPLWNKTYQSILYTSPHVLVKNNAIEVSSTVALDSVNSMPRHILLFKTDTLGNFISGRVLPDSIYSCILNLDRKEYGNHYEHILLQTEYANGYRLFKNDTAFLWKCHSSLVPTNVVSGVLTKTVVNSCFPGSITTSSFSGTSSPLQLKEENAVDCELSLPAEIKYNANDLSLNIFPNPTSGNMSIVAEGIDFSFRIYNSLGEKINCKVDKNEIDLSAQPAGIYFVEILAEGKRTVKKIILE